MGSIKNIIAGATVGTLLGSLAVLIYPEKNQILEFINKRSSNLNELTGKAKEYGESLISKGKNLNFRAVETRTNYWKGGLVGVILGIGTGLLMAPKPGKVLRNKISQACTDLSEKSEEVIHFFKNNSHPFEAPHTQHNGVKKKKPAIKTKKASVK